MSDGSTAHDTLQVEGKASSMEPIMFGPKWMYAQFGVVGFLIVMGCVNMVTQWKDRQTLREETAITRKESTDRENILRTDTRDRDVMYREALARLAEISDKRADASAKQTENILKTQTELAVQISNLTKAIEILDRRLLSVPPSPMPTTKPNDGG